MTIRLNRLPTDDELSRIPVATGGEFELKNEKEMAALRRHIYAINRDGIRRYRTVRDGRMIMVWRIK